MMRRLSKARSKERKTEEWKRGQAFDARDKRAQHHATTFTREWGYRYEAKNSGFADRK
jgi:hypothetical protein